MMLRIFLKLAVLMFAVAGGRLAYDKVLDLPLFHFDRLEVTGNLGVSSDSVAALAGLEMGKSIYKQNIKYAAERLMRQPGVVSCSVNRGFFSAISIDIEAAEPALLVNSGQLRALSREGIIMPLSSRMPVLPLVSGPRFSSARNYDRVKDPDIAYALELYDALMAVSPDLCARLSEINFAADGSLRLFFSPAGTEVLLEKSDIRNGVKRLAVLENIGMLSDTTAFDLRYGPVMIESISRREVL